MAPPPEQQDEWQQTNAFASQRRGKRHATWCLDRAGDVDREIASVACLAVDTVQRRGRRHKTCILNLAALSLEDFEAVSKVSCSADMQHDVKAAQSSEQARLGEIQQHLDDMNLASDALNLAQEDLIDCEKQLQKHVQSWATTSAGLVETVGDKLIRKATPHYRERQRLEAVRQKVVRASAVFLKAKNTHISKRKCERIAANHARLLNEYQDTQINIDRLQMESPVQSWALDAVTQYFHAEDDFRMHIAFSEAAVLACHQRIAEAKAQYQGALRSLEALSEKEHKARCGAE